MQTFLPYVGFKASAIVLDKRRLNKQVLEGWQIYRTITGYTTGWSGHPAVKMWQKNPRSLLNYVRTFAEECLHRGIKCAILDKLPAYDNGTPKPSWLGNPDFHASHRSNLLRKDFLHYSQFGWVEEFTLPYIWPEG